MKTIAYLKNPILDYAWGSHSAIAELMGQETPSKNPQAELWMGAHPKASSQVATENGYISLLKLIKKHPIPILGSEVAELYDNQLPFLFKILAAAEPLSIQAHPDKDAARNGYTREENDNVPLTAPHRNYKDKNHKPECICALTPFWGLCGFRRVDEMSALLSEICPQTLQPYIPLLKTGSGSERIGSFFKAIMSLDRNQQQRIVSEAVAQSEVKQKKSDEFNWIINLHQAYHFDIGVIFPAILNLVCLQPGQAMYLQAGILHAYLQGVGLEIMANSDNVLRGGLTTKHIDVEELNQILVYNEMEVDILSPDIQEDGTGIYKTPAREFELSVINLEKGHTHTAHQNRSIEILLCTQGSHDIISDNDSQPIPFNQGMTVLIPASAARYTIQGQGMIYKAAVAIIQD